MPNATVEGSIYAGKNCKFARHAAKLVAQRRTARGYRIEIILILKAL